MEKRIDRRQKERKKKPQDENIMSASATQGGHNQLAIKKLLKWVLKCIKIMLGTALQKLEPYTGYKNTKLKQH